MFPNHSKKNIYCAFSHCHQNAVRTYIYFRAFRTGFWAYIHHPVTIKMATCSNNVLFNLLSDHITCLSHYPFFLSCLFCKVHSCMAAPDQIIHDIYMHGDFEIFALTCRNIICYHSWSPCCSQLIRSYWVWNIWEYIYISLEIKLSSKCNFCIIIWSWLWWLFKVWTGHMSLFGSSIFAVVRHHVVS